MTPRLWLAGLVAVGFFVGCGGSAARHDSDPQPPTVAGAGGVGSDPSATAGKNTTAGRPSALAGGGNAADEGGTASVGGSRDQGGEAGADAGPALMLPPGCRARTPTETADICSLAVDCDAAPSVRTSCYRLDSGLWECQCANHDSMYRLENAAGLEACALAARLCSDTNLELGEESCEHANESSDADSCVTDVACGKSINLGDSTDARAWLMRTGWVHCNQWEAGKSFGCACSDGALTTDYDVLAPSGDVACTALADFCVSGAKPVFDGGEACLLFNASTDSEGCHRSADCGTTMPLANGVSLTHLTSRFANCAPAPGGGSECYCSEHDTAFLFQLPTAPNDAVCESALENCNPNAVIETTGPATCEPVGVEQHQGDRCQGARNCLQPATVDNRSVVARGNLSFICARTAPGKPWSCSCGSERETTQFVLGAPSANATQACGQAPAACLDRLGLHLGPSTDPVVPPDPQL